MAIKASNSANAPSLRWVTLFTLTALNILNYIDRNIFSALVPAMQRDLHFSDTQMGLLGSAFIFSYTFVAPIFGYLGDRGSRMKTMSGGLLLWSVATAMTGATRSFFGQFSTRVVVGVGEAAYSVISPTVIADSFSKQTRGKTFAIYSCAIPVGSALGYVLGGLLEPRFGWQHAFYIVGVPGVLLTFLLFFLKEPARGQQEDALEVRAGDPAQGQLASFSIARVYAKLFSNGGFLFAVLGYAAYTFVVGGLSFWMPTYIVRYFEGITAAKGNLVFGGVTVVGGFIGTILGGWLADRIEKRSGNGFMKVAVLSMILSVPLFWYLLGIRDFNHFAVVLFALDVVLFMCISPLDAAVVGSVRPAFRATAMALNIFLIHALGDGISRVLMGAISDSSGLQTAVALLPWMLALAGVLWFVGMIGYWQPVQWPDSHLPIVDLPKLQAHRGYRPTSAVQENTLAAFRLAKSQGVSMVECDVQLSSDNQVVIFHDEDLKRIGGSDDLVKNLSAKDLLSRVHAPLLKDLLNDAESPRFVNIELKSGEFFGRSGLEREVVKVIRESGAEARVLFSSFNPMSLRRLAKLAPNIPRGLLVTEEDHKKNKIYLKRMWLGVFARPHLIHVDQDMINTRRMESWNDRHLKVAAWTVNDASRASLFNQEGVISLITDKLYVK